MNDIEYSFNGQREGEKVKLLRRNHPFILVWPSIQALFFFALGILSFIQLGARPTSGLVLVICVLIGMSLASRSFYNFFQSVFIVTDQRLIYVDQLGFLTRKITETEIEKVQDVSSQISGLSRMIFHYGNLVIRTAGASKGDEIIVKNIPDPYEIQKQIHPVK